MKLRADLLRIGHLIRDTKHGWLKVIHTRQGSPTAPSEKHITITGRPVLEPAKGSYHIFFSPSDLVEYQPLGKDAAPRQNETKREQPTAFCTGRGTGCQCEFCTTAKPVPSFEPDDSGMELG